MPDQQTEHAAETLPENGVEIKPRAEQTQNADRAATNGKAAAPSVDPNYQYWRDHGTEWIDGYDQRKKRQVLYHIQELMLTHYMLQHAATATERPLRTLEFGCGVGRHLRNLTRLPDVDAHGYDQSAAMASGILRWAGKQWFDSHVTVGMPTGTLPYPDQHFDIVYTAEVLVHVRPEHIDGILRELVRVCRGHILHIETSEHTPLVSNSHDGCWRHDLVACYARLGLDCQVLPSGYSAHTPYRVKVHQEPRFTWAPAIVEMYRRLERDMNEGFEAAAIAAYQQQSALQHELVALQQKHAAQSAALDQQKQELVQVQGTLQAMTEAAHAQTARADQAESDLRRARALCEQLERTIGELREEVAALTARASELEQLWEVDRTTAQNLANERTKFVQQVAKHLRP